MSISSMASFPGAGLQVARIIKTKGSSPSSRNNLTPDDAILPRTYLNIIPDNLVRLSAKLKAGSASEKKMIEARRLKLVNGEELRLRESPNLVDSLHSQRSRDETKPDIKRQRFCARIHGFVLQFAAGSDDPYLRLSVWRLSRVEQSSDMRTLTILWAIDDPEEVKRYWKPLCQSWARASPSLRHQLVSKLSLRFAPQVRIEYEDFTAVNLARELAGH